MRPLINVQASELVAPAATVDRIARIRKQLTEQGVDAGPDTIAWHLQQHHAVEVSRSTISRQLTARGLVVPEPKKRPKSSYLRLPRVSVPGQ